MIRRLALAALLAVLCSGGGPGILSPRGMFAAQAPQPASDGQIRALLDRLQAIIEQDDPAAYLDLLDPSGDRARASTFAQRELGGGAARAVLLERDRAQLTNSPAGLGYRLVVDAFVEQGNRARIATWLVAIERKADAWRIVDQERVSTVDNLHRLSLTPAKQFTAHNFTIVAEDLALTLLDGSVFTIETDRVVTALVLLGRGEMRFHPTPQAEIEQVRIFSGSDTLTAAFDAAFVRVGHFESHADPSALTPREVDPRDLRRAEQIFREESAKSFTVDVAELTPDTWSLLPGYSDFLAEVRTRRYQTLTYARSSNEPEDIALFERRRKRNIASYASKEQLTWRGRFYNEDEIAPYDVEHYDIEASLQPDRRWIDGRATMRLKIRAASVGQLTMRLANSLNVRSVSSREFGRLFSLRVNNQNTILVNLPATLLSGTALTLTIVYSGRLDPQSPEREALAVQDEPLISDDPFFLKPEPSYLYSGRSYWYPQAPVTDYATASIQITLPPAFSSIVSGQPTSDSPTVYSDTPPRKVSWFNVDRPIRYFAVLVSRFARADRWTVAFNQTESQTVPAAATPGARIGGLPAYDTLDLIVDTNPRLTPQGRQTAERAVDILQFFQSTIGDAPYPAFTVGLIENRLPGGHSPGYFAALNQPLGTSSVNWRNDPASFNRFPEFFLAHEIAHQWWGQAIGWRNYHEQWLSEGFAQYFAALYAEHARGEDTFDSVLRQMRRWAIDESDEGPVYLGYRIGHIRNDGRAFRAIVYNKGGLVLHMLRRLMGDDAFYRGIRRFYADWRYKKAGTEDLRRAMEAEYGRSLERFFERWIYNSTLPQITMASRLAAHDRTLELRFEQTGEIFDVPITVVVSYTDRPSAEVIVPVTDRVVEWRVPLEGTFRTVDVSRSDGTLAEVVKIGGS